MDPAQLQKIFKALDAHQVEYIVFGAIALGLHGLSRATADAQVLADRFGFEDN